MWMLVCHRVWRTSGSRPLGCLLLPGLLPSLLLLSQVAPNPAALSFCPLPPIEAVDSLIVLSTLDFLLLPSYRFSISLDIQNLTFSPGFLSLFWFS